MAATAKKTAAKTTAAKETKVSPRAAALSALKKAFADAEKAGVTLKATYAVYTEEDGGPTITERIGA